MFLVKLELKTEKSWMFEIEMKRNALGVKIEIQIKMKYMLIEIKGTWKILRVWYWYKKKIKSLWCL